MSYEDIIKLSHFHAPGRPYMSNRDRAAQFSPYKSLVGFENLIDEKTDEILSVAHEIIDYTESQEEYPD